MDTFYNVVSLHSFHSTINNFTRDSKQPISEVGNGHLQTTYIDIEKPIDSPKSPPSTQQE